MLDQLRHEVVVAGEHDLVPVEIDAAHGDALRPHDLEAQTGDGETSLVEEDRLTRGLHDLRVQHDVRAITLVEVVGEDALADPDLRSGEADAVLDSMVSYMPFTRVTSSAVTSSTSRALLQDGVAEEPQRVRRHASRVAGCLLARRSRPRIDVDAQSPRAPASSTTGSDSVAQRLR